MRRILIVDDEINVLHALQRTLRYCLIEDKLQIEIYTDPQLALSRSREAIFDMVIADYRMPEMNGADFLKAFKEIQPDALRLMLRESAELDAPMKAIDQIDVFRHIGKPWHDGELKEIIQLALACQDSTLESLRLFDESQVQCGEATPQELVAK